MLACRAVARSSFSECGQGVRASEAGFDFDDVPGRHRRPPGTGPGRYRRRRCRSRSPNRSHGRSTPWREAEGWRAESAGACVGEVCEWQVRQFQGRYFRPPPLSFEAASRGYRPHSLVITRRKKGASNAKRTRGVPLGTHATRRLTCRSCRKVVDTNLSGGSRREREGGNDENGFQHGPNIGMLGLAI